MISETTSRTGGQLPNVFPKFQKLCDFCVVFLCGWGEMMWCTLHYKTSRHSPEHRPKPKRKRLVFQYHAFSEAKKLVSGSATHLSEKKHGDRRSQRYAFLGVVKVSPFSLGMVRKHQNDIVNFQILLIRYGCFLKWWYPQNTSKWSFLVGKPMVVGYHHSRKPPYWIYPTGPRMQLSPTGHVSHFKALESQAKTTHLPRLHPGWGGYRC